MADLVRVEFVNGNEGTVGRDWLTRWPEDIKRVLDGPNDPAPVREETPVAPATTTAPTGEKEKKK